MRKYIFGHTSKETALEVKNYPYGRLRTSMFYWIETVPKKGDRLCQYTINPKNGRENAIKKSTFVSIGALYLDEIGHVQWAGIGRYSSDKAKAFVDSIGGEQVLNSNQLNMLRELTGEKQTNSVIITLRDKEGELIASGSEAEVLGAINDIYYYDQKDNEVEQFKTIKEAEFAIQKDGLKIIYDKKKDFSVKWESATKCRITFDRADGVSAREALEAMRTLNESRLKICFANDGIIHICTRGGHLLFAVGDELYKEYMSSDSVVNKIES